MRHRKVISLYAADPSHAELLDYLDGIEGRNRQAQALLQMLIIGARVVLRQESGDEAWFGVRNPDVRTLRRETKARQKLIPVSDVPALNAPAKPVADKAASPAFQKQTLREQGDPPPDNTPAAPHEGVVEMAGTYEPSPESPNNDFQAYPDGDDDDDFMDPLQRLQMMREE
jgi:hypothetical protein